MFSVYLLRVNDTIKKGGHRAHFFATRGQMYGKGSISGSNDSFPQKDWSEFQDKTFLTERRHYDCA